MIETLNLCDPDLAMSIILCCYIDYLVFLVMNFYGLVVCLHFEKLPQINIGETVMWLDFDAGTIKIAV